MPNWLCGRFTTRFADISRMNYINYPRRYDDEDRGNNRREREKKANLNFSSTRITLEKIRPNIITEFTNVLWNRCNASRSNRCCRGTFLSAIVR